MPEVLQALAVAILNGAAAVAAGAALGGTWLARGDSRWACGRLPALRRWTLAALTLAMLAAISLLWLEAAIMAELPLAQAGPAIRDVVTGTHYGMASCIGLAVLAAATLLRAAVRAPIRPALAGWTGLALLGVFFYTRSMSSHAAADGDLGLAMLVDWIHLSFTSLWVGGVAIAAMAVFPPAAAEEPDLRDRTAYARSLSACATVALGAIVASGVYNAARNLGSLAHASGNPYARLLLAKVALVLLAALLGGINRFFVMPALPSTPGGVADRRFTRILQAESVLLCAVLVLAAFLSATSPPVAA